MLTVAFLGSAVRSHGGSLSENSVRCCRVEIRFNLAGMTGIHLSPTAIARLKACSVQAAHKQLLPAVLVRSYGAGAIATPRSLPLNATPAGNSPPSRSRPLSMGIPIG
jgi:hypothetical protein